MILMKQSEREHISMKMKQAPQPFKTERVKIVFFEAISTFILAYGICICHFIHPIQFHIPNPFATFIVSCFLYFGLSIAGPFSGGHLNPAVTMSLYSAGEIPASKIPLYWCSQVVGATAGVLLSFLIIDVVPAPYPNDESLMSLLGNGVTEMIGTFIFTFGIIYVVKEKYMKGQYFAFFFIAIMLLIGRTFTFDKQCLNPAVAIGLQVFGSGERIFYILPLIFAELIGGFLAGQFYSKFYQPLLRQLENSSEQ